VPLKKLLTASSIDLENIDRSFGMVWLAGSI